MVGRKRGWALSLKWIACGIPFYIPGLGIIDKEPITIPKPSSNIDHNSAITVRETCLIIAFACKCRNWRRKTCSDFSTNGFISCSRIVNVGAVSTVSLNIYFNFYGHCLWYLYVIIKIHIFWCHYLFNGKPQKKVTVNNLCIKKKRWGWIYKLMNTTRLYSMNIT